LNKKSEGERGKGKAFSAFFLLACFLLAGCRPSFQQMTQTAVAANPPTPSGTLDPAQAPERGRTVFNGVGQCATCHSIDGSERATGPGLKGIAAVITEQYPDREAVEFLHESIVAPDAVVFEGWSPDLMPENYETVLTAQQIDDVVAYMLTLE
jgi:mono/diheme cytochrome c family protein